MVVGGVWLVVVSLFVVGVVAVRAARVMEELSILSVKLDITVIVQYLQPLLFRWWPLRCLSLFFPWLLCPVIYFILFFIKVKILPTVALCIIVQKMSNRSGKKQATQLLYKVPVCLVVCFFCSLLSFLLFVVFFALYCLFLLIFCIFFCSFFLFLVGCRRDRGRGAQRLGGREELHRRKGRP